MAVGAPQHLRRGAARRGGGRAGGRLLLPRCTRGGARVRAHARPRRVPRRRVRAQRHRTGGGAGARGARGPRGVVVLRPERDVGAGAGGGRGIRDNGRGAGARARGRGEAEAARGGVPAPGRHQEAAVHGGRAQARAHAAHGGVSLEAEAEARVLTGPVHRRCGSARAQAHHATILRDLVISESTTLSIPFIVSSVGGYMRSAAVSSNTFRHPLPWSRMPANFLSRIICESLRSTVATGSSICAATCAISTHE
mmetsp:Transcript_12881/g.44711  ORF Transcript_12881/g.44711 Transcript_12881/m.44711 type:complete len:253 (-) Transcript_12881:1115-1873(-)